MSMTTFPSHHPPELDPAQIGRLNALLDVVRDTNGFQRERLAGVQVGSLADLRRVPLVSKGELVDDQQANPPFGSNLTFALEQYTQVHQTTGTTGAPLRVPSTAEDWAWWRACFARTLERGGIGPGDRVALAFSFGPHVQFWAAYEGVGQVGALGIALGGMESWQRLETMRDYQVSALICTPSYALHLAEVAFARGLEEALAPVRRVICTGEPGASLTSTRSRIEELWEATCSDHAGLSEVGHFAHPCVEHGGVHVDEQEFVCEILDAGGDDVAPGGQGELVLTALGRVGFPAIRYRTGDVVACAPGPCPAGHPGRWLPEGIVGRTDDMVIIRGMNVFPSAIEQTLRDVDAAVGEFRITFYTQPGAMDEVKLEVELSQPAAARSIQERMRRQLGLRIRVVPLRPGILPREAHKAQRVIDERSSPALRTQV